MKRILITGDIGSGKSRLANRILRAYGAPASGLRSLRVYDAQGQRSFALRTLTTGESWPLQPGIPQSQLFESQVLPEMQKELCGLPPDAFVLIDEIGKMEASAPNYLAFIRTIQAERQILLVRKEFVTVYQIPCALLLDLDETSEDMAFQQALSLFGKPPRRKQTRLILMASGFSRRFMAGQDKLMSHFQGQPLVEYGFNLCARWQDSSPEALALVCARDERILRLAHQQGLIGLYNPHAEEGISASIRLGLGFDPGYPIKREQYIFLPADQPHLSLRTLQALCEQGAYQQDALVSLMDEEGKPGSPVLFGSGYQKELLSLTGDHGGRKIFAKHPEKQRFLQAEALELKDYDSNFK